MKTRNFICAFFFVLFMTVLMGCNLNGDNKNEPKISFNSNGGTAIEEIEAKASSKISAPENPTKDGYTFLGWYTESTLENKFQFTYMPSENTTLYAKWSLKTYFINYETGKGTNNENNPDSYNILQNDIRLLDPVYNGYYFGGWYLDSSYLNPISIINTSSCTDYDLYAKWSIIEVAKEYNIIYHLDGGTNGNNPSKFSKEQASITLIQAKKNGYTFKGWYLEDTFTTLVTTIDTSVEKDVNLYAKFEINEVGPSLDTYSITYYLNGGTNGDNPIRYTENMNTITLKEPTKTSATFKGWYLDKDYNTPVTTIDCTLKQDICIYAKWVDGISVLNYEFDLGIGKEYVLYQVSDTHINAGTSAGDLKEEAGWMTGRYTFAKSFGENYDEKVLFKSSTEGFKAIVDFINDEEPDAVCYTGDLMDYYSTANYDFINKEIAKTNAPYTYSLGNHETPANAYANMSGMNTLDFTVIDMVDFEIVAINDSSKDANGYYYFTSEQYELLKAETLKNKPIVLAIHVPILTTYNCNSRLEDCGAYYFIDEYACNEASAKIIDLIKNNDNIKLVLTGHVHGGTCTEIAPNKYQITCSSGLIGIINKITIR